MPEGSLIEGVTSYFTVVVDGMDIGSFQEVRGLEVSVEVETYREGGQNEFTRKLPGRLEWPNLVLTRGLVMSDNLFEWLRKTSGDGFAGGGNALKRTTAAVTLMDATGAAVRAWEVIEAFPVRWTGPTFAVTGAQALTEQLEIAHHGFRSRKV